jgi:hypothetical protein
MKARRVTDLRRALDYLGGFRVGRGRYAYDSRDEGPLTRYTLDAEAWRDLGARLRRGEREAYSRWCADTLAERMVLR